VCGLAANERQHALNFFEADAKRSAVRIRTRRAAFFCLFSALTECRIFTLRTMRFIDDQQIAVQVEGPTRRRSA